MAAIKTVQSHNITKLDVVISSAGIVKLSPLHTVPIAEFKEHLEVNATAVLTLFQAAYPLLRKASMPKFVAIGASAGSMGMIEQFPYPSGSENDWLIAFPIHPG